MCRPSDADTDFEFILFSDLTKAWGIPITKKVMGEWRSLVDALRGVHRQAPLVATHGDERTDLSVSSIEQGTMGRYTENRAWRGTIRTGWPLGDIRQSRYTGDQFCKKLCHARASFIDDESHNQVEAKNCIGWPHAVVAPEERQNRLRSTSATRGRWAFWHPRRCFTAQLGKGSPLLATA